MDYIAIGIGVVVVGGILLFIWGLLSDLLGIKKEEQRRIQRDKKNLKY